MLSCGSLFLEGSSTVAIAAGGRERAIKRVCTVRIGLRFMAQVACDLLMCAIKRPFCVAIMIKGECLPCFRRVTAAAFDFHVGGGIQNKLSSVRIFVAEFAFTCERCHANHLFGGAHILARVTAHALVLIMLTDEWETGRGVIKGNFAPAFNIVTELTACGLHIFIKLTAMHIFVTAFAGHILKSKFCVGTAFVS